jgi:CHAT domain-containing protein
MGDPVLKGPDPADHQRGAKRRSAAPESFYRNGRADIRAVRELTPLPDTAEELRTIAKALGAPPDAINLREAATETKVKSEPLSEYRIIEFATHALVAGELSGLDEPALVLTPPDVPSDADDGLLTASEIATLKLNADWVVLSACNTAAGGGQGAEALSGLARAFFYAGARSLLVSHWSVYSTAATELTTKTFATLAAAPDIGRAEALRRAMLELITQGRPPGYWAPFVVVGEGAAATGTLPSRVPVATSAPTGSVKPAPAIVPAPTKPAVVEPSMQTPAQKNTTATKVRPKAKGVDWKNTIFAK